MSTSAAKGGRPRGDLRERTQDSQALTQLEDVLGSADASNELLDIVAERLAPPLDAGTWGGVYDAFSTFLGFPSDSALVEPPDLLVLWTQGGETQEFLADALAERPRTVAFMRRAVARYGAAIQRAYEIWKERPDDWRVIQPQVWTEPQVDPARPPLSVIELNIEKNNGERVHLQGSGDSVLALITVLLRTLERLPDHSQLDPRRVLEFTGGASGLVEYGVELANATGDVDSHDVDHRRDE